MLKGLGAALLLVLLASCTARVDGPSVRVKPASIEVGSTSDRGFCPPGLAKQGRC